MTHITYYLPCDHLFFVDFNWRAVRLWPRPFLCLPTGQRLGRWQAGVVPSQSFVITCNCFLPDFHHGGTKSINSDQLFNHFYRKVHSYTRNNLGTLMIVNYSAYLSFPYNLLNISAIPKVLKNMLFNVFLLQCVTIIGNLDDLCWEMFCCWCHGVNSAKVDSEQLYCMTCSSNSPNSLSE